MVIAVDIIVGLYRQAKAQAVRTSIRFRGLIEAGLRTVLAKRFSGASDLRRAAFPLIPKRPGTRITPEDVRRAEAEAAEAEDKAHGVA